MENGQKKAKLAETFIQFIKFNIVGLFNTAFTYGVYSLSVYISGNHFLAVCIDYTIGIATSFVLNKHITFKNKEKITASMIFKMILSYVPSFLLNLLSLYVLIDQLKWNKYLAQLITVFFIAYISFFLQKKFVFHKNR